MEDKRKRTRHSVLDPSRDDEESEHRKHVESKHHGCRWSAVRILRFWLAIDFTWLYSSIYITISTSTNQSNESCPTWASLILLIWMDDNGWPATLDRSFPKGGTGQSPGPRPVTSSARKKGNGMITDACTHGILWDHGAEMITGFGRGSHIHVFLGGKLGQSTIGYMTIQYIYIYTYISHITHCIDCP